MARPANITLDAFLRANENPLSKGGLWDPTQFFVGGGGLADLRVVSDLAVPNAATLASYGQTWNGFTSSDQEAYVVSVGSDIVDDFTVNNAVHWNTSGTGNFTRDTTNNWIIGTTASTNIWFWSVAHSFVNMYAECTLQALPGAGDGCGPIICANGSNTAGYLLYVVKGSPDVANLYRVGAGGALTSLGNANVTMATGTRYRVRRSGNNVIAEHKPSGGSWTVLVTASDTTFTTGNPGIRTRGTVCTLKDFRLDDTNIAGAMIRHSATAGAPTGGSGYVVFMYGGHIQLLKQTTVSNARVQTQLGSVYDVDSARSVTALEGDQVCVQAIGTQINAWYKASGGASGAPWVKVISVTDSTYTSGKIGLFARGESGAAGVGAHVTLSAFCGRSLDGKGTGDRSQAVMLG